MNISAELMQAILNYLAKHPYNEVAPLINGIQTEAAKSVEAADKPPKE
jgi:hypothetical protein